MQFLPAQVAPLDLPAIGVKFGGVVVLKVLRVDGNLIGPQS
jgi:hypothetical protein